MGCGCPRGPHRGTASATPWRRRPGLPHGRHDPASAVRIPKATRSSRLRHAAACGGPVAPRTRVRHVRPVLGAGTRAPGRSRRPRRRRGLHAKGRGASAPTGAPPASPRPPERPSPLALGKPLIAPARPSPAPRGGARAPAPLPGLRRRDPSRHCPQRIRPKRQGAAPSPRPRRTTWRDTPRAP